MRIAVEGGTGRKPVPGNNVIFIFEEQ